MSLDFDQHQPHQHQRSTLSVSDRLDPIGPGTSVPAEPDAADEPRPRFNFRSLNFLSFENRTASRFAAVYFGLFVAAQLLLLFAIIRFAFPSLWAQQVGASWSLILGTGLVCSLIMCFGEFLFHRYLLHLDTVKFLRSLCTSHRTHHKLTSIRFDASGTVRSLYPITDHEHDDQSTFPPWALIPFFAFFTPFFGALAFSFPWLPILLSGYTSIAIAHFLYETIHAAHHEPYDTFWEPRLKRRVTGRIWYWLYEFHLAHHANYNCNQNVAGFFGIPLADMVFGTYKRPDPLLIDGARATSAAARRLGPEPRWPISALDRAAFKRRRRMVQEG